jgi:ribosomal protein S18 acetylase RimI-like enzyme
MYTIRAMAIEDAAVVAPMMASIEPWRRYGLTEERARTQLEFAIRRRDIVLTADVDGATARCVGWCIPHGMFDRSPYLRWLAVHPDNAGGGIGAALLEAVETIARRYGDDIFLLAAEFNTGAHRFYERHGYVRYAILPNYVVAGVAELLYWKRYSTTTDAV